MTNEYELADTNRADLIYEKCDLLAPLLPGMEQPPHPMRLGADEGDYYRGNYSAPGARRAGVQNDLLDPRPDHGGRRPRHPVRPQGRARRAAAGRRDDQPRRPVRRAGSAVPLRRADHRLHRRDPDALPLRADAGRRRRLRLGRRDDQGPARDGRRRRPGARPGARHRPLADHARHRGRARRGQQGRQHRAARQHLVLPLRLRLRGHQRAADHRRHRRDGARPPRAPGAEGDAGLARRSAHAGLRRARQAPRSAAVPGCLRPAQRRRHPGPAARRHRVGVLGLPRARRPRRRSARGRPWPTTSTRCSASSALRLPPTQDAPGRGGRRK